MGSEPYSMKWSEGTLPSSHEIFANYSYELNTENSNFPSTWVKAPEVYYAYF